MPNRQTISYLTHRLAAAELKPVNRFGQNFLVDLNLVELIARSAELTEHDVVLEVGTGMGTLTGLLAQQAGHVVTVEIDRRLASLAQEELAGSENITFLVQDALKNKNRLHDDVWDVVARAGNAISNPRLKLAANLPYNVATPILSNLLHREPLPQLMVATIQKELADRICAKPGSKAYSALSVWIQAQCQTEIIRVLPPTVFWPRPKVTSAILRLRPCAALRNRLRSPKFFHETVRALFLHRRKFLRSTTLSAMKNKLDKAVVDDCLTTLGFAAADRAEQLPVERLIELVNELHRRVAAAEEGT